MKGFFHFVAILGMFLILTTGSAFAQTHIADTMTVTVPFSFTIRDKSFSPGTYSLRRASQVTGVYFIENVDTKEVRTISGTSSIHMGLKPGKSRLVFNNYNGQHFLSQVWVNGNANGSKLPKSRIERELASSGTSAETVTASTLD
jgi:hypothetical protein